MSEAQTTPASGRLVCKTLTFHFSWIIEGFNKKSGPALESSEFFTGPNNDFGWTLQLITNKFGGFKWISLKLKLTSCKLPEANVKLREIKLSIINKDERMSESKYERNVLFDHIGHEFEMANIMPSFRLLNNPEDWSPNGYLTVNCEIKLDIGTFINQGKKFSNHLPLLYEKLVDDYSKMFGADKFTDVTLVAGGVEVKAHKIVLAGRSSVFSAMFDSEMREATENRVDIPDVEYDVFYEFLRFLYTGFTEKIDEMAKSLLMAADKYDVEQLKSLCEDSLCEQLSAENVWEMFVLADKHSCNRLEAYVLDFIKESSANILEADDFKLITKQQLEKALRAVMKKE